MKNIIKAVVLFASVISFSSANAGALDVTGTAKVTYNIQSSDSTTGNNDASKNVGITNELAFTGTGELDNGYTWKYQVELDDNASGATTSDDTRLELTTPYGTVAAYNTEGSLNTKYKFSAAAYGAGSDNGNGASMNYGTSIDSYNNIQYHTPADLLPFSIMGKVAYAPGAQTAKSSGNSAGAQKAESGVTQYQLTAAPISGLAIGASYIEKSGESGNRQGYESGGFYGKYDAGQFTVGAGRHYVANNIIVKTSHTAATDLSVAANMALVPHLENTAFSLGYKVNDALSISVEREQSEAKKDTVVVATRADTDVSVELEIDTIQAAYTMGGMTMSISSKSLENSDYVLGKKETETLFAVAMAF